MASIDVAPFEQPTSNFDDDDDIPLDESKQTNGDEGQDEAASDQGLFGEGDEEEEEMDGQEKPRELDDEELDSGDDEDRDDRVRDEQQDEQEQEPERILNREPAQIATHPLPEGSDGELYLLKIPKFLALEPNAFSASTFQPPTTDHHSKVPPSAEFSAHKTAMKTLRWRRSPRSASNIQSNARILRWSDGSLTLQLATDPSTQYTVPGKPLAPAQSNPRKPTPSSVMSNAAKSRKLNAAATTGYNAELDSFTYLSSASVSSAVVRTTNKLTTSLQIEPSKDASNDAIARLQTRIATNKATKEGEANGVLGRMHVTTSIEDPELAQKRAELAEKEAIKLQRRRENQEMREKERANRVLGRRGLGAGGLSVGNLEDEDELGMGIRRAPTGARKPKKKVNRTGEIYSSDDEETNVRGGRREDEYDDEDGFLVPSDEEEEIVEDDDEDEEDIDEKIEKEEKARGKKRATPDDEQEEHDAEGEPDDEVANAEATPVAQEGSPMARNKRRRVIEDDEE